VDVDEEQRWIVMRRGRIAIACNLASRTVSVPCGGEKLLAWGDPQIGESATTLPGHSVAVLRTAVTRTSS
jgi:maltooligosyltrehalose trehalohydrolase